MKFQKVLEKYRTVSFSEKDKGTRFERLIQAFLKTAPVYEGRFRHIWLWNEFPYKQHIGGKDTGIDLVAQTVDGDFWAIQCKCWNENSYIDKPAVDSFLATSSKNFVNDQLQTTPFTLRLWISTTNNWNSEAENATRNQNPPFHRISLTELEEAPVDWEELDKGISGADARTAKKILRDHQKKALKNFHEHFRNGDRGKLIMACGTGKTFTALKIAEQETPDNGFVLFLVPSIALLGQTLREWTAETDKTISPICICSDPEVSSRKTKNDDGDSFSVEDLALPASTNVPDILKQLKAASEKTRNMITVFSTYQSIDVIAKAQKEFGREFDLVICDEAHRTTGVTLKDAPETAFVKVHDNNFIRAKKRLYMTATPRLYNDSSKEKAREADAVLCSMDVYGLLHSPDYRTQFSADLKKMLPRLPIVEKPADFWAFSKAGRELANLHLHYEEQPPCPDVTVTGTETGKFQVEKMRFPNKEDKTVIEYNPGIRLSGIPLEAYEYVVNGRSAIEWIMERYQIKTDKDSGIKNDPNDWATEHCKPRYILDLLLSIITLSLETQKIVNELPKLHF